MSNVCTVVLCAVEFSVGEEILPMEFRELDQRLS